MQLINELLNSYTDKKIIHFGLFLLSMLVIIFLFSLKIKVDKSRSISQLLIYIVMYFVLTLPSYWISAFFGLISVLALYEIFNCLHFYNKELELRFIKIISYITLPFIPLLYVVNISLLLILSISYFLICTAYYTMSKKISDAIIGIFSFQITLLAILSLGLFAYISTYHDGPKLISYIFFLTNVCDIGALVCGKMFGKRMLIPTISPNKTIAGSVGALFFGMVLSCLFIYILQLQLSIIQALFLGFLVGIFSQVGDLFASIFKRHTGIKDYGNLIPGHGGIIDRFDSLLITLPLFFVMLTIFNYGK